MTISNTTEDAILNLIFRAVTWAGYASATGTETNIGISLHTADPADAGTASTSEMTTGAYTGYTRVNVARSTARRRTSISRLAAAARAQAQPSSRRRQATPPRRPALRRSFGPARSRLPFPAATV
jgi:hypothetical protein